MQLKLLISFSIFLTALPLQAAVSKASISEDLITIMDLSKPAYFTLQDTIWAPGPKILPPGASIALLEGDPNQGGPFTMRIKLPANYEIPPHWCSMDEHISVIKGNLYLGIGDKVDRNKAMAFPAGSFARIPLKVHHYGWTTEETVIQLHGLGPWIMGYVDTSLDPTMPKTAANDPVDLIYNDPNDNENDIEIVEEIRKKGRIARERMR